VQTARVPDARRIVEEAEARLAPLSEEMNLAWWASQVEATEQNAQRRERAEIAWSDALADREQFDAVENARRDGAAGDVARRLDLLRDEMLRRQIPDGLRSRIVELETLVDLRFSRHRGVVGGEEVGDTEIKRILRRSDDPRERREAWEASKTVGAVVADDVRELARLRNDAARTLGHRDWFALSLATDELDEGKLVETLAEADRATAEPFARWKASLDERLAARFRCHVAELRPWHHADPFFQEAPPDGAVDLDPLFEGADIVDLARRTVEGIGLEADAIIARMATENYKGRLQELVQDPAQRPRLLTGDSGLPVGGGRYTPTYEVVDRTGPSHAPCFTVEVRVDGFSPERGEGRSRQAAEKAAAQSMLLKREGPVPEGDAP